MVVPPGEAPIDQSLRGARGVAGAQIRGLEDGAQCAFGGDRVAAHVLRVATHHATETLRPWAVHRTTENDLTNMPSAQILWFGWESQKRVDLALHEQLDWLDRGVGHPLDVLGRVEPDMRGHHGHEQVPGRSESLHAHALALEVGNAADAVLAEQFEAADMNASQHRDRFAGVERRDE